ncbi:unnamed protein product [Acanthoscelides obtectus]|uniref:PWWP domain-containing protein n=1 Tax=Acanthoscelides obtectus TaxID=200917 RepID=A0A9P0L347_ACAOB|nr:unnamed protein product [Acanthoscelides obtectus]CAK1639365.1 Hepatoma-derived growth factor-related protein 2 [Acanthoscelides obtectus]
MKTVFKEDDKVFAKIKGYPAWPARVLSNDGKKYTVKFYGTGETGVVKDSDLFYYTKNKDKFQKPLKRKDYIDAFTEIEEAIEKAGGDGDPDTDSAANDSLNGTDKSIKTGKKSLGKRKSTSEKPPQEDITPKKKKPTKDSAAETPAKNAAKKKDDEETPVKKAQQRNRSQGEKSDVDEKEKPEKQTRRASQKRNKKENDDLDDQDVFPTKKTKSTKDESKEIEFVTIEGEQTSPNKRQDVDSSKEKLEEKSDELDFKVEVVSEKSLKYNITYAKHVKESESLYKGRAVEPREDYINQVLPIQLPSGTIGGLKLHTTWPLKFENEYERALYDESVALRVLEAKSEVTVSSDSSIISNPELFIPDIQMTLDEVKQRICKKEIEWKNIKLKRLTVEANLVSLDAKIRSCLGLDSANPKEAIGHLEEMRQLIFDEIMLKKHAHVVEMVRRLRKYVGNAKEWNMPEESLNEFSTQAEKVRSKAEQVYTKFKEVVKVPEDIEGGFWEAFSELLNTYREDCKGLTEEQIQLLCAEPRSRIAFLDTLDENESEKVSVY